MAAPKGPIIASSAIVEMLRQRGIIKPVGAPLTPLEVTELLKPPVTPLEPEEPPVEPSPPVVVAPPRPLDREPGLPRPEPPLPSPPPPRPREREPGLPRPEPTPRPPPPPPEPEKAPVPTLSPNIEGLPVPINVADTIRIYDPETTKWVSATWNLFTEFEENKYAAVDIATSGDNTIIPETVGKRIQISAIWLTAGGEVNISLKDGTDSISGPMDFGADQEPRGIVIILGNQRLELTITKAFVINLSAAVQVSGTIIYRIR